MNKTGRSLCLIPGALGLLMAGCANVQVINDGNPISSKDRYPVPCDKSAPIWNEEATGTDTVHGCSVAFSFTGCPECEASASYLNPGKVDHKFIETSKGQGSPISEKPDDAQQIVLNCAKGEGDGCQYSIDSVTCLSGNHATIASTSASVNMAKQSAKCNADIPNLWSIPTEKAGKDKAVGCAVTTGNSYRIVTLPAIRTLNANCVGKTDSADQGCFFAVRSVECPAGTY